MQFECVHPRLETHKFQLITVSWTRLHEFAREPRTKPPLHQIGNKTFAIVKKRVAHFLNPTYEKGSMYHNRKVTIHRLVRPKFLPSIGIIVRNFLITGAWPVTILKDLIGYRFIISSTAECEAKGAQFLGRRALLSVTYTTPGLTSYAQMISTQIYPLISYSQ